MSRDDDDTTTQKSVVATSYDYWVNHGTKIIGFIGGTISVLAGVAGVIPESHLKYYMAFGAVLTFWRGYFNSSQSDK
jgi:hypothetical protein